jgi:hypothetical protein
VTQRAILRNDARRSVIDRDRVRQHAASLAVQHKTQNTGMKALLSPIQLHKGPASTMSVTYTAVLPVRDETVDFLAGLLAAERAGASRYPRRDPSAVRARAGGAGAAVALGRHSTDQAAVTGSPWVGPSVVVPFGWSGPMRVEA